MPRRRGAQLFLNSSGDCEQSPRAAQQPGTRRRGRTHSPGARPRAQTGFRRSGRALGGVGCGPGHALALFGSGRCETLKRREAETRTEAPRGPRGRGRVALGQVPASGQAPRRNCLQVPRLAVDRSVLGFRCCSILGAWAAQKRADFYHNG